MDNIITILMKITIYKHHFPVKSAAIKHIDLVGSIQEAARQWASFFYLTNQLLDSTVARCLASSF